MTHDTNSHQVGVGRGKKEKPRGPSSTRPSSHSSPSRPQANFFLVPDPAAWMMSIASTSAFDFFGALRSLFLSVLLPMLFGAAVASFFMIDLCWLELFLHVKARLYMHLSLFLAWLQDHPINFIPFLYLFVLVGVVLVLRRLSWFSVDTDPRPRYLRRAELQSYRRATKPRRRFKRVRPKAPILTRQADHRRLLNLQYSVDSILRHVRRIAPGRALLPCPSCAHDHSVARCGPCCPSRHPSASRQCQDLPFCLNEFGRHVRNSSEGDVGCPASVAHRLHDVRKPKRRAPKVETVREFITTNDVRVCRSCCLNKKHCKCQYPDVPFNRVAQLSPIVMSLQEPSRSDPKPRARADMRNKYRPVPSLTPTCGPGNLRFTQDQLMTATLIYTLQFDVPKHESWLKMALSAPLRFFGSMAHDPSTMQLIWDSGASVSITPNKDDFVGPLDKVPTNIKLNGLAKGLEIAGQGTVEWNVLDTTGHLRTLKLPAYYVPKSPVCLLSTTSLLQTYSDETILIQPHELSLSGIQSDSARSSVSVRINPTNNLPTCPVHRPQDAHKAIEALSATLSVVSASNVNLTEPQKELLRWHFRLGHLSFKRILFIMRSGVLALSQQQRRLHSTVCNLKHLPKCAACLYGKQTRRPAPGQVTSVVRDRQGVLKQDNLVPGQRIAVDHFVCSTKGRLFTSRGKTADSEMFSGGCLFVDHASGYIHVEFQTNLNTHETINAKDNFELMCRDHGVVPQSYLTDNGSAFTSAGFTAKLRDFAQIIRFAGTGAHHHNGTAE